MGHETKYLKSLEKGQTAHRWQHFQTGKTVWGENGDQQDYPWPYQMSVRAVGVHLVGVADGNGGLVNGWNKPQ